MRVRVRLGIDNLVKSGFKVLRRARVGLCTNLSATDSRLQPTLDIFKKEKKIDLRIVFAPEHGIAAALQDQIQIRSSHSRLERTPIVSLYGKHLCPTGQMLKQIDAVAIDLIDIGTRYYTFLWTAALIMEQCAKLKKKVLVLDRPNPLDGVSVQGPVLDPRFKSFVGRYPLPVRHGLTIAEALCLINNEYGINAEMEIVKMTGWKRKMSFPQTGLSWTAPSPNMPSFETALVYPGMCLIEGTNVSEGRGLTRPFEIFGAPWINAGDLACILNSKKIKGAHFRPLQFIPTFHKYKSRVCQGCQIHVSNMDAFKPFSCGLEIIRALYEMYPKKFAWRRPPYEFERRLLPFDILAGNNWIRKAIEKGKTIGQIEHMWLNGLEAFKKMARKYLRYE